MTERKHRVIVHLRDDKYNTTSSTEISSKTFLRSTSFVRQPSKHDTSLNIIDPVTLQVVQRMANTNTVLNTRQIKFDYVSSSSVVYSRPEVAAMFDQLLGMQENCCYIRFSGQREYQVKLLTHLLVTEMEQKLQQFHLHLETVHLDYFDVRKYDLVNLLKQNVNFAVADPKLATRSRCSGTMALNKFIHRDLLRTWNSGKGHDVFDFVLTLTDCNKKQCKLQFSVLFIYFDKLDQDARVGIRNFFENLSFTKRSKGNLVTDCLGEYFVGEQEWRTLLVFELPIDNGEDGRLIDDILRVATAAKVGVEPNNIDYENLENFHILSQESMSFQIKPRISRNAPAIHHNQLSLSDWYSKMDDIFANVLTAMEAYYSKKYKENTLKICTDMKRLSKLEDTNSITSNDNLNEDKNLKTLFENYARLVLQFKSLSKDIEKTQYGSLLSVYLKTKTYEMAQHVVNLKLKLWDNTQVHVYKTIRDEITALTDKQSAIKVWHSSNVQSLQI